MFGMILDTSSQFLILFFLQLTTCADHTSVVILLHEKILKNVISTKFEHTDGCAVYKNDKNEKLE